MKLNPASAVSGTPALTVAPAANGTSDIQETFRRAADPQSDGGFQLTKNELAEAVGHGMLDDFQLDDSEKRAIAEGYASTFTGAGFAATTEAQEAFGQLQQNAKLPVIPVF